jgi:penicillin-binding protein 1A
MQKVYADKSLGYLESEVFEVPEKYSNPCGKPVSEQENNTPEESGGIDDIFK